MTDLSTPRQNILSTNKKILSLIKKRRALIEEIYKIKKAQYFSAFDKERELAVFEFLSNDFEDMSLEELFCFSFIMESQARSFDSTYPKWSEGTHIKHLRGELFEKINPYLLKMTREDLFQSLEFK